MAKDKKDIGWDGSLPAKKKKKYVILNIEEDVGNEFKDMCKKNKVTQTEFLNWVMRQAKENWERTQAEEK